MKMIHFLHLKIICFLFEFIILLNKSSSLQCADNMVWCFRSTFSLPDNSGEIHFVCKIYYIYIMKFSVFTRATITRPSQKLFKIKKFLFSNLFLRGFLSGRVGDISRGWSPLSTLKRELTKMIRKLVQSWTS